MVSKHLINLIQNLLREHYKSTSTICLIIVKYTHKRNNKKELVINYAKYDALKLDAIYDRNKNTQKNMISLAIV